MPAWTGYIIKVLLDWGLSKIQPYIDKYIKSKQVDREVDAEQREMDSKDDEIKKWIEENPGKSLPKHLEDHLRAGAGKRVDGLQ